MAVNAKDLSRPHVWQPSQNVATARTLLLLHGTGADERDLLGLGRLLDPDANLLSPRGLVRAFGMNRYFMRFDDGSFDEAAIKQNADELAEFLWAASGEYGFDANNVYALGFSNGANAGGSMLLLHPESLAGVIAFGTTKSFLKTPFGKKLPDLSGKRVWIANGAADAYSPPEKTAEMIAEFEGLGASVSLMVHPDGHVIAPSHVQRIHSELA